MEHTAERRRRMIMSRQSEMERNRSDERSSQAAIVGLNGEKEMDKKERFQLKQKMRRKKNWILFK